MYHDIPAVWAPEGPRRGTVLTLRITKTYVNKFDVCVEPGIEVDTMLPSWPFIDDRQLRVPNAPGASHAASTAPHLLI